MRQHLLTPGPHQNSENAFLSQKEQNRRLRAIEIKKRFIRSNLIQMYFGFLVICSLSFRRFFALSPHEVFSFLCCDRKKIVKMDVVAMRNELFNPVYYVNEYHGFKRVTTLWTEELETYYLEFGLGRNFEEHRFFLSNIMNVACPLRGWTHACGNDTRQKILNKADKDDRFNTDERRYYMGIGEVDRCVRSYFAGSDGSMALILDVTDCGHNGAMYIYRVGNEYRFIGYNPNRGEIFNRFGLLAKKIYPRCPGFYVITDPAGNPDGFCRMMSYNFIRGVMEGQIDPRTEEKSFWWCLSRNKRICNALTLPDLGIFYPRGNVKIHGDIGEEPNKESCPAPEGICLCGVVVDEDAFVLPECGDCERVDGGSPMYNQ